MQIADDSSFNRLALKSAVPTIALFVAPWSDLCEPYVSVFHRLEERHAGQLRVVVIDADLNRVIAETFGVQAVPAYLLFRDGELLAQGQGYLPEALIDRFFEYATTLVDPRYDLWRPTEQEIEDLLILPMLAHWGWASQRQFYCRVKSPGGARRGMIDILVSAGTGAPPITLFENKRRIGDHADLRRAANQALGYAIALDLGSFVVADAAQLWIYQVHKGRAVLAQQFTGYEVEQHDTRVRDLLLALSGSMETAQ